MIGVGDKSKSFRDILGWINSDKGMLEDFYGNVIYLEFWDHTNMSSIASAAFTKEIWDKYSDNGLEVIGVHCPEFEFERYLENIEEAVARYGIEYPVAQDNNCSTWLLYGNRYLPRQFIIDKNGYVAYENIGQGNRYEIEKTIRDLLEKDDDKLGRPLWEKVKKEPLPLDVSPETYFGSKEIMSIKKFSTYQLAHEITYNDPGVHELNKAYLNGNWKQFDEFIENEGIGEEYFLFRFVACKVFMVVSSYHGKGRFDIFINDQSLSLDNAGADVSFDERGQSFVEVGFSGLLNLYEGKKIEESEIKIVPRDPGLQLYVISFE